MAGYKNGEEVDTREFEKEANRSPAFTADEKNVLLGLIEENKSKIESKMTDFGSTEKKKSTWEKIAKTFNSQPNCSKRDVIQLKNWWNNSKKRGKKEVTKYKRELYKTGGGKQPPELSQDTMKILAIIPSQMKPLENDFDSDCIELEETAATTESSSDNNITIELPSTSAASTAKSPKISNTKKPYDPRSTLIDFEMEEHKMRMKILGVEYDTAILKRKIAQKQLDLTENETTKQNPR